MSKIFLLEDDLSLINGLWGKYFKKVRDADLKFI